MTQFGDQVYQFGGVPVASVNYAGWWGNDVWFVDDQNGNDKNNGKRPSAAKSTIQAAVTAAGPNDTIFLRPRDIDAGRYHEHGYYTGSIATKSTDQGLSIIGTGSGYGTAQKIQCMIEPASAATVATIQVNSPAFNIENCGIKQIDESLVGAINATSTFGTVQAWGMTVSNCFFKDFQSAGSVEATIQVDTAHWVTIQHCTFREADMAINGRSTEAAIRGLTIRDCDFWGAAADVDNDIRIGDCKSIQIDKCRFLHSEPTAGSLDIYISFVGTSCSGIVSHCAFSSTSATIANVITLADAVIAAGNHAIDYLT